MTQRTFSNILITAAAIIAIVAMLLLANKSHGQKIDTVFALSPTFTTDTTEIRVSRSRVDTSVLSTIYRTDMSRRTFGSFTEEDLIIFRKKAIRKADSLKRAYKKEMKVFMASRSAPQSIYEHTSNLASIITQKSFLMGQIDVINQILKP